MWRAPDDPQIFGALIVNGRAYPGAFEPEIRSSAPGPAGYPRIVNDHEDLH